MVKKYCSLICTTVFLLCFASSTSAQEDSSAFTNRFAISFGAGYQLMQMNDFNNHSEEEYYKFREDEFNPVNGAMFFTASAKYSFTNPQNLYARLGVVHSRIYPHKGPIKSSPTQYYRGSFDLILAMWSASVIFGYGHKLSPKATLFVEAGPTINYGHILQKIDFNRDSLDKHEDVRRGLALGALANLGIEYRFNRRVGVSASIGYLYGKIDNVKNKELDDYPFPLDAKFGPLNLNFSGFNAGINLNYYLF